MKTLTVKGITYTKRGLAWRDQWGSTLSTVEQDYFDALHAAMEALRWYEANMGILSETARAAIKEIEEE